MPDFEKIEFMPHAWTRMKERNVQEADATSTICSPDQKTNQYHGNHGGKVYLHSKNIGTAKLFVCAEIVGKKAYVITAYWEGGHEP